MGLTVAVGTERNAIPNTVALFGSQNMMNVQKAGEITLHITPLTLPASSPHNRCSYVGITLNLGADNRNSRSAITSKQ
jgi:hypothetical protein